MNKTNDEYEISLPDIMRSIWEIRWIIAILIILGGIMGFLLSTQSNQTFETNASMLVTTKTSEGNYENGTASPKSEDVYLSHDLAKTVQVLAVSNRVLNEVLDKTGYTGISLEELKNQIQVTAEEDTPFLYLTLSWNDPHQGIKLLDCLMDILPDIMLDVMDIGSVNIIDQASQTKAAKQHLLPYRSIGLGAIIGFLLGCLLGIVYYLFIPKVRDKSILESLSLDIVGEIPVSTGKDKKNAYLDDNMLSFEYYEAYGRFAAVFCYLAEQKKEQVIAITSSIAGEGKSTVAYNLALRLTEMGHKVLLLDFDFKKGVLYQLLKTRKPKDGDIRIEPRNGENLEKLVEKMYSGIYTIQGFSEKDIFQVENKIFPAIREMKSQFDYILIDTPPAGILADVQLMRGLMDSVLLVIRQDLVSIQAVTDSISYLEKAGIRVMGGVLNCRKTLGNKYIKKYKNETV